jgi:steroid delta-isomerase-like uncharacterized protein
MSQALIDAAKAPILAYNAKNWEAVKTAIAPGYVYDEIGTQRTITGAEKVIEVWRGWATALPDSKAQLHGAFVSGNTVVLELTWTGTHSGPLQTPEGTIPASGRTIELRACQITEVTNGKAQATRQYFDMATLLKQIGVEIGQTARAR